MNGIIEIEGMEFFAYHGCYETERKVGNKFLVDLYMEADCSKAAESDDINDSVNYQKAYELVQEEVMKTSHLLENVCKRILDSLYNNMEGIKSAKVKVRKLNPPMGGQIYCSSVTLQR
ncbi:dihydroneopterin aldolase [Marinilabiliaceae bacterium JC040]|nr:dihydroneopterin aldolase [Marinilabiliaceae bacterium JC040]